MCLRWLMVLTKVQRCFWTLGNRRTKVIKRDLDRFLSRDQLVLWVKRLSVPNDRTAMENNGVVVSVHINCWHLIRHYVNHEFGFQLTFRDFYLPGLSYKYIFHFKYIHICLYIDISPGQERPQCPTHALRQVDLNRCENFQVNENTSKKLINLVTLFPGQGLKCSWSTGSLYWTNLLPLGLLAPPHPLQGQPAFQAPASKLALNE